MARFNVNFISHTLVRAVDITVVVPSVTCPECMVMPGSDAPKPSHTPKAKYPVLYLLHGFANNHATWAGYARVELFAEEHQMAVVMLSAENKFYRNQPNGDRYFDFVSEELPEFIKGYFPISDRPEDTYIAGLSMGGYGTFLHGFSHPERFAAMCPLSAAVRMGDPADPNFDPATDPKTLAEGIIAKGGKLPKLYIACGKQDFLYKANVEFRDWLIAQGADVTWDETEEHGHEWRFWDLELEKLLKWLPRTDAYAGSARKV